MAYKIISIQNDNMLKKGDTAWWFDADGDSHTGTITSISSSNGRIQAVIQAERDVMGAPLADCWPTKEALYRSQVRRSKLQTEECRNSITDVEGLVRFLFDHMPDQTALDLDIKEAARTRAYDLLGFDPEVKA